MKLCSNWSRGRKIALVVALVYLTAPLFTGIAFGRVHIIWLHLPYWPGVTPCPLPVPIPVLT